MLFQSKYLLSFVQKKRQFSEKTKETILVQVSPSLYQDFISAIPEVKSGTTLRLSIAREKEYNFRGRITNLPAESVSFDQNWGEGNCYFKVKGKVRQAEVFSDKLMLNREITVFIDKPEITTQNNNNYFVFH